jgi:hypothetical protein
VAHPGLGGAHVLGDPREHLIRSLDDDTVLTREVASAEDRERIVGERRQHIRTVRSAARSRNRPRRPLAWFLVAIILVLIALAVRANADAYADPDLVTSSDADPITDTDPIADAVTHLDPVTGSDSGTDTDAVADVDPVANADADSGTDTDAVADVDPVADTDPAIEADSVSEMDVVADADPIFVADAISDPDDAASGVAMQSRLADALLVDGEPTQSGAYADDELIAVAGAGVSEIYEAGMRDRRSSRWGRLDVGIEWQRRSRDPLRALPYRVDEIWLVATWRR